MSMNSTEKGTLYEIFINNYLNESTENQSWLWKFIPLTELRKANILNNFNEYRLLRKSLKENETNSLPDLGTDLLLKRDEKYILIQCKNFDEKNTVNYEHLAGFYIFMLHYRLPGKLFYTSKLSKNLRELPPNENIEYIKKEFQNKPLAIKEKEYTNLIDNAYDYQIEAYEKITTTFTDKNRAILQLPCGLGKTLISMLISLNYQQIIIVSPLKEYCIQNLERYKSELKFKDYQPLLIDSDGCRDVNEIKEFIKKNKKIILSVCYKSCDILHKIMTKLNNYIVIIDEFHNITKNDIQGESEIGKILVSNAKILFMSATPRIFHSDEEDLENEDIVPNENIFGRVEYTFPISKAINEKRICDYQVYIPDIETDNNLFIEDINKEVDVHQYEKDILIKSNFILRGMMETGSKKLILYARNHEESFKFKDTLMKLNEYFALDLSVSYILSSVSRQNRKDKLNEFIKFNGFSIIVNVEILNECIDIPICDSVFMSYPSKSKIRTIQRMMRSNRLDISNKNKVSKIFLWNTQYDDMNDFISTLKEFDDTFTYEKVKIIKINDTDYQILERDKNQKKYQILDNYILKIQMIMTWEEKFEKLKEYIRVNGKFPSAYDNNNLIHILGVFWQKQNYAYKTQTKMMRHQKYYDIWTNFLDEYKEHILDNDERWVISLNKVKEFMIQHDNSPSQSSPDENYAKLGKWLISQKVNCKNRVKMFSYSIVDGKEVDNHPDIVQLWKDFNIEFKKYLLTNEEAWICRFNEVKEYIDKHKKKPSSHSKDENIKSLSSFISTQKKNYEAKTQIMSVPEIYNTWTEFLNDYGEYFLEPIDLWKNKLNQLIQFIDSKKKRPNKHSTDVYEKQLGEWLVKQSGKVKNNKMKNDELELFNDFTTKYDKFI